MTTTIWLFLFSRRLPSAGLVLCFLPALAGRTLAQVAEKTAGETYKNVQVLANVPASTFMNTMFFQRYALGVSCSYCHVDGAWDKDDKATKRKAREMLRMVLDLNQKSFGGKAAVNCMTCHRGSTTPLREIIAPRIDLDRMLRPRPTATPSVAIDTPDVSAVLRRYIAGLGGAEALSKVHNRVTTGQLLTAEGGIVPFEDTYAASPASWLSVRHFGGDLGDFSTGFDGAVGWNRDNRGLTEQKGEPLAALAMKAALQNPTNIEQLYSGWKVTGVEVVGSTRTVVLSAVANLSQQAERLYFDVATGLLLRRSVITESVFGPFTTDTYFESYRLIDSVMVPILVSEFTPDFGTVRRIQNVETNTDLKRAIFAKPAAALGNP